MSVKFLTSNAKQAIETTRWKTRNDAKLIRQYGAHHVEAIFQTLTSFLDHTLWSQTEKEPGFLRFQDRHKKDIPLATFGKQLLGFKVAGKLVLFRNSFYDVRGPYTDEEAVLLVKDWFNKRRSQAEFIKSRQDVGQNSETSTREPIPEQVRNEVWRRDGGKCVRCGSVRNLEFDHMIPVSKGGSNTARNLQLLCETCNRQKSNRIG